MDGRVGARVVFNGREVDYFAGCGYLGLQSHPGVIAAAQAALQQYGISTATSRGGYGEHPLYQQLEQEAAQFFGAEKVLYFVSGYLGMSILTQTESKAHDHLFIDDQAHYCLWDAAHATNKAITPFHHLSAQHLQECLQGDLQPGERPLVLSDGVFPISGEIAPLPEYLALVRPLHGRVYVDDAHAVGVLGENGRGTAEHFQITEDACKTSATLSKALGGWGGIVWGKTKWIDRLDRCSRIMVGASPPPLVMTAASASALSLARTHPEMRQRLLQNVRQVRNGLRKQGWQVEDSPVPIICLRQQAGVDLHRIQRELFKQGVAIEFVRSYTSTPAGGALRIAIFATHSQEQIERLLHAIQSLCI